MKYTLAEFLWGLLAVFLLGWRWGEFLASRRQPARALPLRWPAREPKLTAPANPEEITKGLVSDEMRETMIRDAMREGLNRMEAEKDVDSLLSAHFRDQPPG